MMGQGLRRSVAAHYLIVVFITLVLVEAIFLFCIKTYYYEGIYNYVTGYISTKVSFYETFLADMYSGDKAYSSNKIVKYFSLNHTELQVLNKQGQILSTSNPIQNEAQIYTLDVTQAMSDTMGRWIGKQPSTGEHVMAITTLLEQSGDDVCLLRYVISLEKVNQKIITIGLIAIGVGLVILTLVLLVSFGLANSIVRPIKEIMKVSQKMAQGRFDVRITGGYRYELGELASTLNYMADEIVRINKLKNDFVSSISHELRTPLTGIKGWSETLKSEGTLEENEMKLGLEVINKETDRLISLVEELLDFSKLQQNRVRLNCKPISMQNLIDEIILQVRSKANQKEIFLFPEVIGRVKPVLGDINRLKQVFLNIIDNAIKFSHPKSNIYIVMEYRQYQCEVRIKDSGIGISEEHVKQVMDKFYQVNPLAGGTGLGLAITKELVELHGGRMEINSKLNEGTTLIVTLPLSIQVNR